MKEFSKEELEILVEFLGCQEMNDTQMTIEWYELDLNVRKTENAMQKLYDLLKKELEQK